MVAADALGGRHILPARVQGPTSDFHHLPVFPCLRGLWSTLSVMEVLRN